MSPQICVETGTHKGLGSTQLLLGLAARTPSIRRIYTMEVSRSLFIQSQSNLGHSVLVTSLFGLSVPRKAAREFIQNDPLLRERGQEPDIYIDFLPDPVAGYLQELDGAVGGDSDAAPPEDLLGRLLPEVEAARPLFCLDSAGGLGLLEYRTVRKAMGNRPFGLWLDDINHVKHYRSSQDAANDPVVEVLGRNWEEGWMLALVNGEQI